MKGRYNHAVTLTFEVISDCPNGDDITGEMLQQALQRRIENLDSEGDLYWEEACLPPDDTYEMDEE